MAPSPSSASKFKGAIYQQPIGRVAGGIGCLHQPDACLRRTRPSWPIPVHCDGCMDWSPAWMGIYRFVVQQRPLLEILRENEQHRSYRPKGSVTILYNRVLAPRAPEHYRNDPTAAILRRCVAGTSDPKAGPPARDAGRAKAVVADQPDAGQ
jgi:hypothetical protein